MSTHLFEHRASPPRSRAAWLASFAVHALMFAALAYISWATLGGGNSQKSSPEVGVVVGLNDGAVSDSNVGDGTEPSDGEASLEPFPDAASRGEPSVGDLAAGSVIEPLWTAADAAAPLTPAPQLPPLSLGPSQPASSSSSSNASRTRRTIGSQLGQLEERATVTVFGAVGEGSRFVYVFDRSTSMDGAPLLAAKQQLLGSLVALKSVHQFQVIFFNHSVQVWDITGGQQRIPYATDSNKRFAGEFVRNVVARGATERWRPLRAAIALEPDIVFFLTDCDDNMSQNEVDDVVERANRHGTKIACIEYGFGPSKQRSNFLTEIASRTEADYAYVDTTKLFKQ